MLTWRHARPRRDASSPDRVWALDLETTGLDPDRARILSVGMVPLVDDVIQLGGSFTSLVDPSRCDPDLATQGIRAHHLRPQDVASAPPLRVVLPAVLARITEADGLLVHHAPLDIAVLRRVCGETNQAFPDVHVIDTVDEVQHANRRRHAIGLPALPTDLAGARAQLGLPAHHAHEALHDAVATAELHLVLRAVA